MERDTEGCLRVPAYSSEARELAPWAPITDPKTKAMSGKSRCVQR